MSETTFPRQNSVILIELNELSPPLMKRFMDRGVLPNFKKLYDEADVWVTEAKEKPPYLEPWIQWITVHNGINYDEHKVFNLDEGHTISQPAIWDVLSDAGLRTWICSSMNPRVSPSYKGMILPDPWTTKVKPQPAELEPFFSFVQRNVQEHTNDKAPLSPRDIARFGYFMARHGLSKKTMLAIAKQLASERATKGKTHWKRAMVLDRILVDVFVHYFKTYKPHFSTVFANSTAHFQHMHWRNMEPHLFKVAPTAEEQARYSDAVELGYRSMDKLVGELIELAGRDTTLIFATALSQQACLLYEEQGGKVAYRPGDFDKLLRWAGVEGKFSIAPVMTQYFHVIFDDEVTAGRAAEKLRALNAAGTHALHVDHNGKELFCGCRIYKTLDKGTRLTSSVTKAETGFFDMFYKIEGMKSGMHHPDGMFWVRTPERRHQVHDDKLPLDRIAPMILDMFGIEKRPATMRGAAAIANGSPAISAAE